jgi:beta-fructofuranosidase
MIKKMIGVEVIIMVMLLFACSSFNNEKRPLDNTLPSPHSENLIFHLPFDENQGNLVEDQISKKRKVISYVFTDATYQENRDPKWVQSSAVRGSALVFDGYSNKIAFDELDLNVEGKQLTIDVFVAPRMFEWSAPGDFSNLQVIAGQYNKKEKKGFLLGIHKYGHYSFQIGLGDQWVELWNEWNPLNRYEWNHLTATFNGETGEMKLYKNGEIVNDKANVYGKIQQANQELLIGASQDPQYAGVFELNMFNGIMDELKIFNREYNASDVLLNHQIYYKSGRIQQVSFQDVWLDRAILENDIYRPIYHANPPQNWMNEPHSLFYYKGYYHMFYQFNLTGPYWRQIVWGHWVSEDMVTWINLKEAIIMEQNSVIKDGAWSGSVAFQNDGTPVLFITAGDDEKVNLYSNQNLVIAVPKDLNDPFLLDWEVQSELSVKLDSSMGRTNEFRDFSVYKEDDTYYMLATGSKFNGRGTAYLYSTQDDSFLNWTYHGHLFEPHIYPSYLGSSWELVHLVKLWNKDKTLSKYAFILSPAGSNADNDVYYYLGNFNKKTFRFEAEHDYPLKMDFGENVFTGPGIYHDIERDRVLITSITQDLRSGRQHYLAGWAHNAGMPKEILLNDQGSLIVKPIDELYTYVKDVYFSGINLTKEQANIALSQIETNSQTMYAKIVLENLDSTHMGFLFKKDVLGRNSSLMYDFKTQQIILNTRNSGSEGSLRYTNHDYLISNQILSVEILIDHSMIEIYINEEKTMTASIYSLGNLFEILSDGQINVRYITVNEFKGEQ